MKLEDVYYFSMKKILQPKLFALVEEVIQLSAAHPIDEIEVQKKINAVSRSRDNEHLRQASNLVAEIAAFADLTKRSKAPHWVPELKDKKMPDLEVDQYPIEVKHLNSPRAEHDALADGQLYGGSVDTNYHIGLDKKVGDFIKDARKKFISYNHLKNDNGSAEGTLYLYFSKSIDAGIADSIEWMAKMEDRIEAIAKRHLLSTDKITLEIRDIDQILE